MTRTSDHVRPRLCYLKWLRWSFQPAMPADHYFDHTPYRGAAPCTRWLMSLQSLVSTPMRLGWHPASHSDPLQWQTVRQSPERQWLTAREYPGSDRLQARPSQVTLTMAAVPACRSRASPIQLMHHNQMSKELGCQSKTRIARTMVAKAELLSLIIAAIAEVSIAVSYFIIV